jgi:hypothetical protein
MRAVWYPVTANTIDKIGAKEQKANKGNKV